MPLELLPPPDSAVEETPTSPRAELRLLTEVERALLKPDFDEAGVEMPDPRTSQILGAIRNGEIVGFQVLQLMLHADPMKIKPGHEDCYLPLIHAAEKLIAERCAPCDVFVFAPPGKITELARHSGMTAEPWTVFSKRILPRAVDIRALDEMVVEAPTV